jgi:outer membrane receptor protein involved in Fe transport
MRFFLVLLLCSVTLSAQQGRGSIFGQVTDPSAAGVPNATVRLIQVETNGRFRAVTGSDGSYSSPGLPVGTYRVEAEVAGFKRGVRSGLVLQVDQRMQVDLALELGSTSEQIEVQGDAVLVDTGSATVGKVIENKRVQELPINGRNALALVLLTPGVKSQAAGNASGFADRGIALSAISINGGPSALNNFTLDGGNNNQGFLADVNANPTVDAVQEFKVQSAVMSAEYGFTAGGVINVVTKSGTNALHGTLYHFLRNDALDARPTFSATKPPFRYNQFGGAAGAPVWIPKLYNGKDRTFFFYNYEAWRFIRTTNPITSTPIEAWRRGDFSTFADASGRVIPIFDPSTTTTGPAGPRRTQYPGNVIPANQLDPGTVALLRYFPPPNRAPVNAFTQQNNYLSVIKENREMQQHTLKIDHRFSDKNTFFGRYLKYRHYTDGANAGVWPDPVARARFDNLQNQNVVLNDVHTFTPSLLNEFRIAVARSYFPFQAASFGQDLPRQLNLHPSIPSDTLPNIQGTGFASFGAMTVGLRGSTNWQLFNAMTWITGKHSIKIGYDHRINRANNYQRENPSHVFNFGGGLTSNPASPAGTGSAFATFLTGNVSSATGFAYLGEAQHGFSSSAFVQDDWRATRRLTLNLGLRWDYQQWPVERWNGGSNFNPNGIIPSGVTGAGLRGTTVYAGIDYGRSPFDPIYSNFGPRIGMAYDIRGNGKTVFRAGYSIFYPSTFYRDNFGATQGFANTSTAYAPPGGDSNFPAFRFRDGLPFAPIQPLGSKLGPAPFLGQSVSYDQGEEKVPMSQQWTASLQQEVKGWLFEAAYSANKANHLVAGGYTLNDIPLEAYSQGAALQQQVDNPFAGRVPGALGAARITRLQSLRPFPYYQGVTARNPHLGSSLYHALLATVERRFANGFVFLLSYTKAKLMSDSVVTPVNFGPGIEQVGVVGYQNGQYDRRAERSLDPTDISDRLVISSIYQLPFKTANRFANILVAGEQHHDLADGRSGGDSRCEQFSGGSSELDGGKRKGG